MSAQQPVMPVILQNSLWFDRTMIAEVLVHSPDLKGSSSSDFQLTVLDGKGEKVSYRYRYPYPHPMKQYLRLWISTLSFVCLFVRLRVNMEWYGIPLVQPKRTNLKSIS